MATASQESPEEETGGDRIDTLRGGGGGGKQ